MDFNYVGYFAYICPSCFTSCGCSFDVFRLSNKQPYIFRCAAHGCDAVCAQIRKVSRDKYSIQTECPYCGKTHKKELSFRGLWDAGAGYAACPATGLGAFFYGGNKTMVGKAVSETAASASGSLNRIGSDICSGRDPILSEMLMILDRRFSEHSVSCICGSVNITFDHADGRLSLICKRCGRRKSFAVTKDNLLRLMNASEVILGV